MTILSSSAIDNKNIDRLANIIKESIIIEDMILYRYNSDGNTFNIINNQDTQSVELEDSFLKYAIDRKKPEFDNHINSNKYYKVALDNPKDLTIRGLLMFPIIDNKKTIGVLSLYRSVKQGINFTKKDKTIINEFKPLLLKAIKEEVIEDSDNLLKDIALLEDRLALEINLQKELSHKNQALEDELKRVKESKEIKKQKIATLKQTLIELENENSHLVDNIKDKNILITKYNNNEIKAKHSQTKLSNNFVNIEKNIEFLLQELGNKFKNYHNAYILFETILYAISCSKSMDIIDKFISKTRGFDDFINQFYSSSSIKANRDKYQIKNILNNIEDINFDKSLPISLVIDTPKINSIVYHIVEDLAIFQNDKNLINIDISYNNHLLHIKIDGRVYKNSSLFKKLFKQTLSDDHKDRKGLAISNRLIKIIKGNLTIDYNDKHYQYDISIPAKVLDLNFI